MAGRATTRPGGAALVLLSGPGGHARRQPTAVVVLPAAHPEGAGRVHAGDWDALAPWETPSRDFRARLALGPYDGLFSQEMEVLLISTEDSNDRLDRSALSALRAAPPSVEAIAARNKTFHVYVWDWGFGGHYRLLEYRGMHPFSEAVEVVDEILRRQLARPVDHDRDPPLSK